MSVNDERHALEGSAKNLQWRFVSGTFTDFIEHYSSSDKTPCCIVFAFYSPACAVSVFYSCGAHEFFKTVIIISVLTHKLRENVRNFSLTHFNIVNCLEVFADFFAWHSQCQVQVHNKKHDVESEACIGKHAWHFWFHKFLTFVTPFTAHKILDNLRRINNTNRRHKTCSHTHSFSFKTCLAMRTRSNIKHYFLIELKGRGSPMPRVTRFCTNRIFRFLLIRFYLKSLLQVFHSTSILCFKFLKLFFQMFIV